MEKQQESSVSVCHIISGDLWGGAEAQAFGLIVAQSKVLNVGAIVFNAGELYSKLTAAKLKVDVVDESKLGVLRMIRDIFTLLKKNNYRIVHVHGFKENLVAGLASKLLGVRLIRTHHGQGMVAASWHHTLIEKINAGLFCRQIIAVSQALKDFLIEKGIGGDSVRVIRNGIDASGVANKEPSSGSGSFANRDKITVGTVGRLVPVKNHKCLIDAIQIVNMEDDRVRLLIVGDGPLMAELKAYVQAMNLSQCVEFAGFQEDVDPFLQRMDLFVLSSLSEGIPISLLEAMSAQLPAICTRVGGIPEIIKHGENGFLVESDNAGALARACMTVIHEAGVAETMSTGASASVDGELSFANTLSETISLYNEA